MWWWSDRWSGPPPPQYHHYPAEWDGIRMHCDYHQHAPRHLAAHLTIALANDALSQSKVRYLPTRTAPTNGWSKTHRVAMFAILRPPWRWPMVRSVFKSDWKRVQLPQALTIISRYLLTPQSENSQRPRVKTSILPFSEMEWDCQSTNLALVDLAICRKEIHHTMSSLMNMKRRLDRKDAQGFRKSEVWCRVFRTHLPYHEEDVYQWSRTANFVCSWSMYIH